MAATRICSVPDCSNPRKGRDTMCGPHAYRRNRYGSPTGGGTFHGQPRAFLEAMVSTDSNECVFWPFGSGYASIRVNGRYRKCHNLMCEMAHGPAPAPTLEAAHSCGNGHLGCVNPRHLRWATQDENRSDKVAHRRLGGKLSEEQVLLLRSLAGTEPIPSLAARFGISRASVHDIVTRRRWSWLP